MPPSDLALDQRRVDGAADVVGGGELVRASPCPAPCRPRPRPSARRSRRRRRARPGPLSSSGCGRRVVGPLAREHVAVARRRQARRGRHAPAPPPSVSDDRARSEGDAGRRRRHWPRRRICGAQRLAGQLRRLAGDEGLARGRGLAGVGGQVGVGADELEASSGHAERVGGDLGHDGVGALADVDRALVQAHACRRRGCRTRMVEGLGSEVLPQPYQHAAEPDAAAPDRSQSSIGLAGGSARLQPAGPQRLQARRHARARLEHLAGRGRCPAVQRVDAGGTPAGRCRSRSARSSNSVSWAIAACGTPKPRKAPGRRALVCKARPRAR